jgi:hypothetical protein
MYADAQGRTALSYGAHASYQGAINFVLKQDIWELNLLYEDHDGHTISEYLCNEDLTAENLNMMLKKGVSINTICPMVSYTIANMHFTGKSAINKFC